MQNGTAAVEKAHIVSFTFDFGRSSPLLDFCKAALPFGERWRAALKRAEAEAEAVDRRPVARAPSPSSSCIARDVHAVADAPAAAGPAHAGQPLAAGRSNSSRLRAGAGPGAGAEAISATAAATAAAICAVAHQAQNMVHYKLSHSNLFQ